MNKEQRNFFNKVIKQKLIDMAIDGSLPSDLNELQDSHFEDEAKAYNNSDEVERRIKIRNLSLFISDDDAGAALDALENTLEKTDDADSVVTVIEALENQLTIAQLLDLI
jgi:uncharacterized protein with ATP-grasp and redox domains